MTDCELQKMVEKAQDHFSEIDQRISNADSEISFCTSEILRLGNLLESIQGELEYRAEVLADNDQAFDE